MPWSSLTTLPETLGFIEYTAPHLIESYMVIWELIHLPNMNSIYLISKYKCMVCNMFVLFGQKVFYVGIWAENVECEVFLSNGLLSQKLWRCLNMIVKL